MADTDAGASGADMGRGAGSRSGSDSGTGGAGSARVGTNSPAALREVARIAEERGFGEARGVHVLGGGDVGCVSVGLALLLLIPGVGILIGPYGTVATTVAIALLAVAVALPFIAFRYEAHRDNRIPRLHVLDGGMIITHPTRITAYAWPQIRVVERVDSVAIGQGGSSQNFYRLQLFEVGGDVLCSMGQAFDTVTIVRLAIAGGARTS